MVREGYGKGGCPSEGVQGQGWLTQMLYPTDDVMLFSVR